MAPMCPRRGSARGSSKRVAVTRPLIGHPPLIVADEPTSSLDAGNQGAIRDLLFAQVRATATRWDTNVVNGLEAEVRLQGVTATEDPMRVCA
jgi:predicted ABC-type transport system involved in lysophospholipase L1 biosynthesis ATPase subunit